MLMIYPYASRPHQRGGALVMAQKIMNPNLTWDCMSKAY